MIDYQLKPFCNECNYLKLCYEQETINWDMCVPVYLKTTIWCDHQEVCGKYNEVLYSNGLEYHSDK